MKRDKSNFSYLSRRWSVIVESLKEGFQWMNLIASSIFLVNYPRYSIHYLSLLVINKDSIIELAENVTYKATQLTIYS
jgi:hypothetical protein